MFQRNAKLLKKNNIHLFISSADLAALHSLSCAKESVNHSAANSERRVRSPRNSCTSPAWEPSTSLLLCFPQSWFQDGIQTGLSMLVMPCCIAVNCCLEQFRAGTSCLEAGTSPASTFPPLWPDEKSSGLFEASSKPQEHDFCNHLHVQEFSLCDF